MAEDKDAASPQAKDERAAGPGTVRQAQAQDGSADQRLGASDHVGKPRMYAESAVEKLDEDPLPETPPGGKGKDK